MYRMISLLSLSILGAACGCGSGGGSSAKQIVEVKQEEKETKSALTDSLVREFNVDEEGFCALQYYIAGDLTLVRTVSSEDDRKAKNGKLVRKDGKIEEFVEIKKGTPAVCKRAQSSFKSKTVLDISFEQGTILEFVLEGEACTAKTTGSGSNLTVDFQGARYTVKSSEVKAAFLRIEREDLKNYEARKKVMTGVKLSDVPKESPKKEPAK